MRKFTVLLAFFIGANSFAQIQVSLDNWYNNEVSAKTGLPYHYLWTDTLNSGFSQLGSLFTDSGAKLSTLKEAPSPSKLSETDIYIIVDPDTTSENPNPNYIQKEHIKIIKKWVKRGGVLLLMANDGPNCEFTHFNNLSGEFGIRFNAVTLNPVTGRNWEMGAETNLPDHPLFKDVNKIYMKEVASIETKGDVRKVLIDGESTYIAECSFGKGFVLAIGDPWLYNEYIDHKLLPDDFENLKAAKNMVGYLFGKVDQ